MSKAPAFQFYAGDFLTDVMDWTDEEVGVHIRLLAWSWVNRRGVPRDTQRLTRIAPRAIEAWPVVGAKWSEGPDDTWVNDKLENTRSGSDAFRASQRERSLKAVAARMGNNSPSGQPMDAPMDKPNGEPMGTPMGDPLEDEDNTLRRKERARAKPVELVWPPWAGEIVKSTWEDFKEHRWTSKRQKYKTAKTEQLAINLLAKYYRTGKECVEGLNVAMAKGWLFPVEPTQLAPVSFGQKANVTMTKTEADAALVEIRKAHGIAPGGLVETQLIPKEVLEAFRRP